VDKDQARVVVLNLPDIPGVAAKITKAVASKNIVIDMIMQSFHATSGLCDICFTVHESDLKNTIDVLTKIKDELGGSGVLYDSDIAKVSLIGAGLAAQPGVAAKVFDTLATAKINIKMIATSEMKLTCVIAKDQADKAANAIHEAFQLETSDI
jgi:aspartate kinase